MKYRSRLGVIREFKGFFDKAWNDYVELEKSTFIDRNKLVDLLIADVDRLIRIYSNIPIEEAVIKNILFTNKEYIALYREAGNYISEP